MLATIHQSAQVDASLIMSCCASELLATDTDSFTYYTICILSITICLPSDTAVQGVCQPQKIEAETEHENAKKKTRSQTDLTHKKPPRKPKRPCTSFTKQRPSPPL